MAYLCFVYERETFAANGLTGTFTAHILNRIYALQGMSMKKRIVLIAASFLLSLILPSFNHADAASTTYYREGLNGTVCLTIDDGDIRASIVKILDTLRDNGVNCTFFIIGDLLMRDKALWQRAVEEGNEICYHTMHHKDLTKMSNSQVQADIDLWNKTLGEALPGYQSPKLARFPGGIGASNKRLLALFAGNGYKVVGWSVDISRPSFRSPNRTLPKRIKQRTKANSIILIHCDTYDANALPRYIGWLKSHFKLSKVSDAFAAPSPSPASAPVVSPCGAGRIFLKPSF
jgi:peptidoglycan/xylan/chitin deacetylase (PgdA/CDA1 family)